MCRELTYFEGCVGAGLEARTAPGIPDGVYQARVGAQTCAQVLGAHHGETCAGEVFAVCRGAERYTCSGWLERSEDCAARGATCVEADGDAFCAAASCAGDAPDSCSGDGTLACGPADAPHGLRALVPEQLNPAFAPCLRAHDSSRALRALPLTLGACADVPPPDDPEVAVAEAALLGPPTPGRPAGAVEAERRRLAGVGRVPAALAQVVGRERQRPAHQRARDDPGDAAVLAVRPGVVVTGGGVRAVERRLHGVGGVAVIAVGVPVGGAEGGLGGGSSKTDARRGAPAS